MKGHRIHWTGLIFGLLLASGCGSDTQKLDERVSVENANPTGSVGGLVYDGISQTPISSDTEVLVTVIAGDQTMTTTVDENGLFSLSDVPASGPVQVLVTADGYLSAHLTADFTNEAGEFPVSNAAVSLGPIGLIPATGSLSIQLFDDQGFPVTDAALTLTTKLRYLLWQEGRPMAMGTETVGGTSDSEGRAQFDGLPDYWSLGANVDDTVILTVPPLDYDGDGIYDFPGNEYPLSALHSNGPDRTIVLSSGFQQSLTILSSNVAALETNGNLTVPSVIAPDDSIRVVFSLPVDQDSLLVRVLDEAGENTIETSTTLSGRTLEISFASSLAAGSKFHLQIHATSSIGNQPVSGNFYAPLYTAAAEPPRVTDTDIDRDADPSEVNHTILVFFNQPVGPGNPNRTSYSGGYCVVWFNYDLDGTGRIGDIPPEVGSGSCNRAGVVFSSAEKTADMPGARLSGFSSVWRISFPQDPQFPATSGGQLQLLFSGVTDTSRIFSTPDGHVVPDQLTVPIP